MPSTTSIRNILTLGLTSLFLSCAMIPVFPTAKADAEAVAGPDKGQSDAKLEIRNFQIQNRPAKKIADLILPLIAGKGTVIVDAENSTLIIQAESALLDQLGGVIEKQDQQKTVASLSFEVSLYTASFEEIKDGQEAPADIVNAVTKTMKYKSVRLTHESKFSAMDRCEFKLATEGRGLSELLFTPELRNEEGKKMVYLRDFCIDALVGQSSRFHLNNAFSLEEDKQNILINTTYDNAKFAVILAIRAKIE